MRGGAEVPSPTEPSRRRKVRGRAGRGRGWARRVDGGLVLVLVLLRRQRWLLQQHRLLEVLGLSVDLLEFLHQHLPAKGELRRQGVGPRPSPGITLWAGRVTSQKA